MIAQLTGTVIAAGATHVVLDLNGFGVKALCTPATAAAAATTWPRLRLRQQTAQIAAAIGVVPTKSGRNNTGGYSSRQLN